MLCAWPATPMSGIWRQIGLLLFGSMNRLTYCSFLRALFCKWASQLAQRQRIHLPIQQTRERQVRPLGRAPGEGDGTRCSIGARRSRGPRSLVGTVRGSQSRSWLRKWAAPTRIPEPTHPSRQAAHTEKIYYFPTPLTTVSSLYAVSTFLKTPLCRGGIYNSDRDWLGKKKVCLMSVSQVISSHSQRRSSVPSCQPPGAQLALNSDMCSYPTAALEHPKHFLNISGCFFFFFFFFTYQAAAYLERSQDQLCQS